MFPMKASRKVGPGFQVIMVEGDDGGLKELQRIVGGNIEVIHLERDKLDGIESCLSFYVHEDAGLRGSEQNSHAMDLQHGFLCDAYKKKHGEEYNCPAGGPYLRLGQIIRGAAVLMRTVVCPEGTEAYGFYQKDYDFIKKGDYGGNVEPSFSHPSFDHCLNNEEGAVEEQDNVVKATSKRETKANKEERLADAKAMKELGRVFVLKAKAELAKKAATVAKKEAKAATKAARVAETTYAHDYENHPRKKQK